MAKTQEELNALKQEYETVTNKLQELTENELSEVTGGSFDTNALMKCLQYANYHYVKAKVNPYVGRWGKVDHYSPIICGGQAVYVQILGDKELRLFYRGEVEDYTPNLFELYQYVKFDETL